MPEPMDPRRPRPRRPADSQGAPTGEPRKHDAFTVDTRRTKGNRRAMPGASANEPSEAVPPVQPHPQRPSGAAQGGGAQRDPRRDADRETPHDESTRQMPTGNRNAPRDARAVSDGRYPQNGQYPPNDQSRPRDPRNRRRDEASRADAPMGPDGPQHAGRPAGLGGPGGPEGPGGPGGPASAPRKRRVGRGKKIVIGLLVVVLLWVGGLLWAGNAAWSKVQKVDALPSEHLAKEGAGHNTLIVGSDGRGGLTTEQKKALGTGNADGQRTDSIMVLHTGGGKPTLMSIPRDSYVTIPGHRKNKINASFSLGGPQLLIQTIEQNTGIHIDDYMEIGFGGFASVVDAVGGVDICVARDMDDKKAHINLKKGCQSLDGPTALGYVRARYSDPEGDIGRAKRQRQFLGALMKKIGSPSNLVVPWKLKGLGESGAQGLAVGKNMSMMQAVQSMWALKSFSGDGGNSVVIPISNLNLLTPAGSAVQWDATRADELFKAIRENGDTSPFVKKGTSTASTTG